MTSYAIKLDWRVSSLCMALAWGLACSSSPASDDTRGSGTGTTVPSASKPSGGTGKTGASGTTGASSTMPGFGNTSSQPTTAIHRDGGGVDGSAPDQGGCGAIEVEPMIKMTTTMTTVPGNLLLVFDKSGSMNEAWNGGSSKWLAATGAVTSAITPLKDKIAKAGAIFFPLPDGCNVPAISSGQQIDFMPGAQFVTAWNSFISANNPNGMTPTGDATVAADSALMTALPMLMGTTAVVLITDGDPNCNTDDNQVLQLVGGWLSKGVMTHVLGLPGSGNAMSRLTAIAVAGGTNTFILPTDPMALQMELEKIVSSSVQTMTTSAFDSCTIMLPMKPPNPDDVNLVVTEMGVRQKVDRDLGTGGGWTLDAAATEIVLQGLFCDFAKMGKYEKISVAFGCVDYPPLPPPHVQ